MYLFDCFSIVFRLLMVLNNQRYLSSDFSIFHISRGTSSRALIFSIFSVLHQVLPPSTLLVWLISNSLILILKDLSFFPNRFFKCSFHFSSLYSWLAAFSLALKMIIHSLTFFTIFHVNHHCLSSSELLISLIWSWMYSNLSFWCVLVPSWFSKVPEYWNLLVFHVK